MEMAIPESTVVQHSFENERAAAVRPPKGGRTPNMDPQNDMILALGTNKSDLICVNLHIGEATNLCFLSPVKTKRAPCLLACTEIQNQQIGILKVGAEPR